MFLAFTFPPNVTSLVQPCGQGILRSMKTKQKDFFLNCMLDAVNRGIRIQDFLKEFSLKDAIYALVNAWKDVTNSTLKNACHKLWPTMMFDENEPADKTLKNSVSLTRRRYQTSLLTPKVYQPKV
jgi:hypothetical protein